MINLFANPGIKLLLSTEKRQIPISVNATNSVGRNRKIPEVLMITSYPPRECGIATYSQDLIKALDNKFNQSFKIGICPIESLNEKHAYTDDIKYILNTDQPDAFFGLANAINSDTDICMVLIQHEFGFYAKKEPLFKEFLLLLKKPVIVVFHTILPNPSEILNMRVNDIASIAKSIIVMTHSSKKILVRDYAIRDAKITVIPHGTHLVPHADKELLKDKFLLSGRSILSTFGLLSSGKSIETTLMALPNIVRHNPTVLFLIIGKTHPSVIKQEGEKYRELLTSKIEELGLQKHVLFLNAFLPLPELLEYLQLTDIYLFTSKDPNQAVSGTFSYALSCGCPIVSTPIPHAIEVLRDDAGIIIDFSDSQKLSEAVNKLLANQQLRKKISSNALHLMASTAWQNAAISHAMLLEKISNQNITLAYTMPDINLDHIKKMTTGFGMIQFSEINQPDLASGYTLDDNARAMIAIAQHFELTNEETDIQYIAIYLNFIKYCLQAEGKFLNYVDAVNVFTDQNHETNLADSNGRAIWALGYLISLRDILPEEIIADAELTMKRALLSITDIHSTRAMAFIIKGLYYRNIKYKSFKDISIILQLANRLVQMYRHEADKEWRWFESYLTYANSILPEALLCAWLATGDPLYKELAKESFDFLLSKIFTGNTIKVISNKGWLHKGKEAVQLTAGGEQPIDIAYTILALNRFNSVFANETYLCKMKNAFNWFLGNNHLHRIIYNPCTGGCYDGLEENDINLNQGAESTVSYLMARLVIEKNNLRAIEIKLNNSIHVGKRIVKTA